MNEEINVLKDKLESTLITRTFNVSGMPVAVWSEVDDFCKEYYGDSRWSMVADLVRLAKDDWRFRAMQDEIDAIKENLAKLSVKEPIEVKKKIPTFGKKE